MLAHFGLKSKRREGRKGRRGEKEGNCARMEEKDGTKEIEGR